ncbi:hypothetical protein ACFL0M_02240 [Thermodesulfobacteriota bacterium]
MKKILGCMIAVILVVGLMGISGSNFLGPNESMAAEPILATGTPLVKMSKDSKVVIMGSGFKPGQEVRILFTSPDGLQSDIGYALKPTPKADKTGSWATTWNAGRYVSKKLIKGGAYKILAADEDYNPIAHTPVFFQAAKKKAKAKKK